MNYIKKDDATYNRTNNQLKLLTYWKEESEISIWLNYQTLDYLEKWHNYLTIPPIIISALSSIVLIITSNNETTHIYGNMIIGILLIISTFIQSYKKTIDLENRIVSHKNIIQLNQELILDIQEILNQLSKDINNDNDNDNDTSSIINEMKNKKKYILKKKINIPKHIYTKLENKIELGEPININQTSLLYKYLQEKIIDISPDMLFSIHSENEKTKMEDIPTKKDIPTKIQETNPDLPQTNNKYINQINYKLSQL